MDHKDGTLEKNAWNKPFGFGVIFHGYITNFIKSIKYIILFVWIVDLKYPFYMPWMQLFLV